MSSPFISISQYSIVLLVSALLVSSCSSTSDSNIDDAQLPNHADTPISELVDQNSTRVEFSITVPAYPSNALQVLLTWGNEALNANWLGDEYWSVSGEFAANTEQLLTVTFYDRNGELALAQFSEQFATGSNQTESVQILSNQFDASQFDNDGDGFSNLDELLAGKDPELDEDSLLEIRDSYRLPDNSRLSITTSLEGRLSDERPFLDTVERFPEPGGYPGSMSRNLTIDVNGNGTLIHNEYLLGTLYELAATRTNSGSAITWEGSRYDYDGDYAHNISFNHSVAVLDDTTRRLIEQSTGTYVGTYSSRWNFSFDLTGRLIEQTKLCEPVSGTVSIYQWGNSSGSAQTNDTTISKEINQPYWRIVRESSSGGSSEYFVRELGDFNTFICDYLDI